MIRAVVLLVVASAGCRERERTEPIRPVPSAEPSVPRDAALDVSPDVADGAIEEPSSCLLRITAKRPVRAKVHRDEVPVVDGKITVRGYRGEARIVIVLTPDLKTTLAVQKVFVDEGTCIPEQLDVP